MIKGIIDPKTQLEAGYVLRGAKDGWKLEAMKESFITHSMYVLMVSTPTGKQTFSRHRFADDLIREMESHTEIWWETIPMSQYLTGVISSDYPDLL